MKSHLIKNARLENKNVIKERVLGSSLEQTIYDELSENDIRQIKVNGGEIESLDLQSLFNALVE